MPGGSALARWQRAPDCAHRRARSPPALCVLQVERRGTMRGGFYDPGRSKIQAMKEIKVPRVAACCGE